MNETDFLQRFTDGLNPLEFELEHDGDEEPDTGCTGNTLTLAQAANLGAWAETLGGEELVNLWTKISQCGNLDNIKAIHGHIGKAVVASVQKARAAGK